MNTKQQSKTLDVDTGEKGVVLIAAIALMAVLALVGVVAAVTTNTEIKISSNYNTSVQASYAAQAGIEEARARLRGLSSDANYAGDPAASPNETWSAYILTSDNWASTDDPDYVGTYTNYIPTTSNHENTATETNTIQATPDISYWAKIRHKKWSDCTATEQTAVDTSNTSGTPGDTDIIYYGYVTSTSTTAEQFTSDTDPDNASPVEIITSYGSSGNGSGVIEVQARKHPGPPVLAPIYGYDIDADGDITINGNDACGSEDLPAVAYVNTEAFDGSIIIDSSVSIKEQITPALDINWRPNKL
ncbi:MAG: pilus assembly PilX N-terminal domain-containing protein [Planctomycetota bacterium]|jgi:Tfp pilus assembly protein PilX